MKHSVRILGAILTIIYCFAVRTVPNSPASSDYGNHQTAEQEQYLGAISNSLFCHTSQSESSGNNFNNSHFPNFKNLFDKLSAITKPGEQFLKAEFTQYFNFSIIFLIQHQKRDIIFPFHFFW